jgi:hypothetical protein
MQTDGENIIESVDIHKFLDTIRLKIFLPLFCSAAEISAPVILFTIATSFTDRIALFAALDWFKNTIAVIFHLYKQEKILFN